MAMDEAAEHMDRMKRSWPGTHHMKDLWIRAKDKNYPNYATFVGWGDQVVKCH